jgi:hypothetical protein
MTTSQHLSNKLGTETATIDRPAACGMNEMDDS